MAERKNQKKLAPMKLNTRSNRGDEKVKLFSYNLFKKKKSQNKGCFLAFYPFLFVKKNKMPDLGSDGWEDRKRGGGRSWWGVWGLPGTIKNTARTIPFLTPLFPSSSSYRFSHPLFPFFI